MGFFSWITSDTHKSISNAYSTRGALPVYLLVPDDYGGEPIYEPNYDGYGRFDGRDAYDLVADWNRLHIPSDLIERPDRSRYSRASDYEWACARYCTMLDMIEAFSSCEVPDRELAAQFGDDFKRRIGIWIAGSSDKNAALRYPLKFVEHPVPYDDAEASRDDPDQGYFY